jgi:NTP pyrophosphatase (non-canonical NTP hydrolase)
MKMRKAKNGKLFSELYEMQIAFQTTLNSIYNYSAKIGTIPEDNVQLLQYHMLLLFEEAGELLKSDKRWKNYRNEYFDKDNKLEEICDCFIALMNVAMFSGFTGDELEQAIEDKIEKNYKRIKQEIN